jgi:hypothetical protein
MERPQLGKKSFEIPKRLVCEAWMKVQANNGALGVDAVSIEGFAEMERANLSKLWNRMSSGCYFPGPAHLPFSWLWRSARPISQSSH